jgi:integrase
MRLKLTSRAVESLKPSVKAYDARDTEIKGFLVRVQPPSEKSPLGRKAWFYQYRTPAGKQTRSKLGDHPGLSADGARSIALVQATEVGKGIDLVARKRALREEGARARHRTLEAFLDARYEPWSKSHHKSATMQMARLRSDFVDWLDRPMHELNLFAVEGLRQRWKKAGMQPRSINRDLQRLQSVLSRAVEWGVLDKHPLAGFKQLKTDKSGRVRFLATGEESALRVALVAREERLRAARLRFNTWRVARGLQPLPERTGELLDHLKPMVLVALNTGLRRGELFSLRWADVNLGGKMLTVVAASAKSGHTRRVPLNTEALAVLTAWRDRHRDSVGLVFAGAGGERLNNINRSWRGVVKGAKLTDFKFHDLRHTFASKLVQAGVDLNTVRELLGHSEIAMTLRYSHLAPDNLRLAVEKVAQA